MKRKQKASEGGKYGKFQQHQHAEKKEGIAPHKLKSLGSTTEPYTYTDTNSIHELEDKKVD